VSISDEHDLQERLDRAFQAITPHEAPLNQAVRQGRLIRVRRRLAAAAGLAVVAAGIAVPAVLHQQASQPALNGPRHPAVIVHPAGPHAPAGRIAFGTAGGRRWRLTASKPGTAGAARNGQCFTVISLHNCGPVPGPRPSRSDPVSFTGTSDGLTDAQFGSVSAAVSYVTVRLADGTSLALHPVSVYGTRFVGYAVPRSVKVSSITAYSAHGELASTIPFNEPEGTLATALWLRPGQTGMPRAAHLIGSGTVDGHAWSSTAHVGPWGECLVTRGNGGTSSVCDAVSSPQGTMVLGSASGPLVVVYGTAAADVQHVIITLASGQALRIRAIRVGEQKFFVYALLRGQHSVRWQSYNAARRETGSGHITRK
jgi:hypothetical protein